MSASGEACCPSCGVRFCLRAEAEGKKVKCRCGEVFVAALEMVAASAPVAVTDQDLELDEPPASPAPAPASRQPAPLTPPPPGRVSPIVAALEAREDDAKLSRFRELWLPAILLITGAMLHLVLWDIWLPDLGTTALVAAAAIGAQVLVFCPVMFFSMVLAVKYFDVGLGPLPGVLRKIVALTLGPAAIGDVLFTVVLVLANFDWEVVVGGFGFYLVTFGVSAAILFEMGVAETAFVVLVNFIPRVAVAYPVAIVLQQADLLK